MVACLMCCVPSLASLLSTYGSTPAFFAVCANVERGDRHTLILSTELISGMFYLRIALSGVCLFYLLPTMRHLQLFLRLLDFVSFPLVLF